jgi:alpha-ketoglutarate-dependent taurine dioxygenase
MNAASENKLSCPSPRVRCATLQNGVALPLVLEPDSPLPLTDLLAFLQSSRPWLDERLTEHDFEAFVTAINPRLRRYTEGQSQRAAVQGSVYTSTEYPAPEDITLHNELSYVSDPPERLFFFCETAPATGGETPIADCRRAYQLIAPALRDRFVERRVRYVKNMHGGMGFGGKSWQEHFETTDREAVEAYLTGSSVEFRWKPDGTLWTSQVRPAAITHPATGETVWFNQADLWHYTNLGKKGATLLRLVGEDGLPTNAYYGDGTPMEAAHLEAIRQLFWREATIFRWEAGDVLMLDNRLVAHGRRAYTGERRILVAMT